MANSSDALHVLAGCGGEASAVQVIARRALLGWLYAELQSALDAHQTQSKSAGGKEQRRLFRVRPQDGRFEWAGDWELHMFVTQTPCGSASIYAASEGGNAGDMTDSSPNASQIDH